MIDELVKLKRKLIDEEISLSEFEDAKSELIYRPHTGKDKSVKVDELLKLKELTELRLLTCEEVDFIIECAFVVNPPNLDNVELYEKLWKAHIFDDKRYCDVRAEALRNARHSKYFSYHDGINPKLVTHKKRTRLCHFFKVGIG